MKIFFSYFSIQKTLRRSIFASIEGDFQKAIQILEPVLKCKELLSSKRIWKLTWITIKEIFHQAGEQELAALSKEVSYRLDNADHFYHFGHGLIEKGLYTMAIPILKRGVLLFPNDERILTELSYIFEQLGLYKEAKECLLNSPNIVEKFFMPRYLVVFYSIMMGDLEDANKWFSGLGELIDYAPLAVMENFTVMFKNIKAMLERARLLSSHTSLNSKDLRGWNAVINGNVVLHLSEYDLESMGGRYAFYQESPAGLFSCINQLMDTLESLSTRPERILSFPDRDSCILSHVVAKLLQCSVEIFSEETGTLPGLIVCYSSESMTQETFDLLTQAQEDQIFWCHASNWTQSSIAPDFISYFAQCACPPWDKQISLDWEALEGKEVKPHVETKKPLEGSYHEIAESICKMIDTQEVENNSEVKVLAQILFCDQNDKEKNKFNMVRYRSRQWVDSPVSSEEFSWNAD